MVDSIQADAKKSPRWKFLIISEVVLILLWVIVRNLPKVEEAGAIGATDLIFAALIGVAGLVWLLFLSRLGWQARVAGVGIVAVVAALVKIDGHTGSFFPQFSWRWSKNPASELPKLTGTMAAEGTVIQTEGPQFFPRLLGSEMKNWVSGELLPDDWYETEPKELWRINIGEGWSAFSVAGDFAFTMEQLGDSETVLCYELKTGKAVWAHEEKVRFEESMGDDGPRSTPTIIDGKVFAYGATGILNCLDARTGKVIWGKNVLEEFDQSVPKWAKSCSPLVVDGKVVVTLGSEAEENLAAFEMDSGNLVWRSGNYESSYASPVVATLAGKRQIVAVQQTSVDGYDIESGEILWSFSLSSAPASCATPLIVDDSVIVSRGYGKGTHRIKVTRTDDGYKAEKMWHTLKLRAKFADMVIRGDSLYGLSEGRLVCLNLEDGSTGWRGDNFGHGQLLGVGDHMILQEETGEVSVVELDSSEQKITSQFDALDHRTWNHPTLAGRILLVRNDREAIAYQY